MNEKKKARWEENRELIEEKQMEINQLSHQYDALKQLTAKLVTSHATLVNQMKTANRAFLGRRPNLIMNQVNELEQLVLKLDTDDAACEIITMPGTTPPDTE